MNPKLDKLKRRVDSTSAALTTLLLSGEWGDVSLEKSLDAWLKAWEMYAEYALELCAKRGIMVSWKTKPLPSAQSATSLRPTPLY